eukprot:1156712-Pelagomonas_calceolata.AAC.11
MDSLNRNKSCKQWQLITIRAEGRFGQEQDVVSNAPELTFAACASVWVSCVAQKLYDSVPDASRSDMSA